MTSPDSLAIPPLASILVDIDSDATAQPALAHAARLAARCGARLRVVDVLPGDVTRDAEIERRRQHLARLARGFGVPTQTALLAGDPAEALLDEVSRHGHDLIVRSRLRDLVSPGPRWYKPVDLQLLQRCPCPVWTIGAGTAAPRPRITAAVDLDPHDRARDALARRVVETARVFARYLEGTLRIVHAWQPVADRTVASHTGEATHAWHVAACRDRVRAHATAALAPLGGLIASAIELRRGRAAEIVPAFVVDEGIDLVVMGTAGGGGLRRRFFGGTSERLLERLPCSTLIVKPAAMAAEPVCTTTR